MFINFGKTETLLENPLKKQLKGRKYDLFIENTFYRRQDKKLRMLNLDNYI